MIRTGRLNSLSFGSIFVRDLMVGNKSSFKRKKADRALGVLSNCWYSSGRNLLLTSVSLKNLPTCHWCMRRKIQWPNIFDTGRAMFLTTGVENSQIASGGRSVGIAQ
jgi:hypothetical protein